MIAVIRIHGRVKLRKDIVETLNRLNMKRKFSCVLIDEKDSIRMGMLKKVSNFVAFGEISEDLLKKLKSERGEEGKQEFRLHPPRGGFKKSSKLSAASGKGILGKHKDIGKLLERML